VLTHAKNILLAHAIITRQHSGGGTVLAGAYVTRQHCAFAKSTIPF
jgi:hypothetical protein